MTLLSGIGECKGRSGDDEIDGGGDDRLEGDVGNDTFIGDRGMIPPRVEVGMMKLTEEMVMT